MTRLRARLDSCRRAGRAAVVGYLPAGFPDRNTHQALVARAFSAGLDALEIGLPSPAPPTEGPTITAALAAGRGAVDGIQDALLLAAGARTQAQDVLIALAYDNVVDAAGIDFLLQACEAADVDAILLPQQDMDTQVENFRRARSLDIDVVVFLHRHEEIGFLVQAALDDPIIYLQSATQHTGEHFNRYTALQRLRDVRSELGAGSAQILAGFGVSTPHDVEILVRAGADGAVVGTAVVEAAARGADHLEELIVALRSATLPGPQPTPERLA